VDLTGVLTRGRVRNARLHPASRGAVNFLLSDMRGALGPYLNAFVFRLSLSSWALSLLLLVAIELSSPYIRLQVAAALPMAFSVATERLNLIRAVRNGSGHQDRVVPPHL
jgi:hypothetical protein